ncbi:MAG: GNAT family N-acetyltransferase [Anaerolineae bacterium]|nr:GNAT family N-acetyltransferase [Anaerolineae bacterium]
MNQNITGAVTFAPAGLPAGFALRGWRDDSDYEKMRRIVHADRHSLGIEESISADDLKSNLETMPNMDIKRGVFLVEAAGEAVAYKTLRGYPEAVGQYCYNHHGSVLPEYKKRGIGLAMIRHSEQVLREIAATHPAQAPKAFQVFLDNLQRDLTHLLEQEGYAPVRYFYTMLRPNLGDIPGAPLPDGIEVRAVEPGHLHAIWLSMIDAFSEHWGETEHTDEAYELWLKRPSTRHDLWQIAWDGNRVVAVVLNTVDAEDNALYNRKRGFTEDIATLKAYRGRGLAQALIARGLRQFRELGMTEAALEVDTENGTGALKLYGKLGYRPIRTMTAYRKAFQV